MDVQEVTIDDDYDDGSDDGENEFEFLNTSSTAIQPISRKNHRFLKKKKEKKNTIQVNKDNHRRQTYVYEQNSTMADTAYIQ